jgi:hypothetical protein
VVLLPSSELEVALLVSALAGAFSSARCRPLLFVCRQCRLQITSNNDGVVTAEAVVVEPK